MWAVQSKQTMRTRTILVQHEIFTKQPDLLGGLVIEFGRRANWMPIPSEQLTHRCALAGLGQPQVVLSVHRRLLLDALVLIRSQFNKR